VYKSAFDPDVTFTESSLYVRTADGETKNIPADNVQSTTMHWPDTLGAGVAYSPLDPLTLSLDVTRTHWSQSIIRNFDTYMTADVHVLSDMYFPMLTAVGDTTYSGQVDTYQTRLGAEYVLIVDRLVVPLRIGLFTDSQYFVDASGNGVTFLGFTMGAGVKWNALQFDLAMVYEIGTFLNSNLYYGVSNFDDFRVMLSVNLSL
jgi:long-subunit fatty acid transport protein